ncbi:TPA: HAD hydrolase-like protein [Neisseria meningitidis]
MKKNNILILSAGRRVELVQDFQTEAARFSDGISVFATDLNPRMSSACHVSDGSFEVPPISADSYIDSIFNLAVRENIGLIIPTIDTELQKLADERERFEAASVHIVVSDSDFIAQCRDKRKTATLFARYGIRSPEIYDRKKLVFPCFAKPYDGRSLTQRLKLEALGLSSLFDDILISEACSSEKPDSKRFRHLQDKYADKAGCFIYIGDNISKDFIAPNTLGWITIGLLPSGQNIHRHQPESFNTEYHPDFWVNSFQDLVPIIDSNT